MESNTVTNDESMPSENSGLEDLNGGEAARPDWDPYAVWLTHIMKTPANNGDAEKQEQVGNDSSWNPYSVWQALIKN